MGGNEMSDTPNERTLKLALEIFTELANTLKQERDEARSELSLKQQTLTIAEGTLCDLRKQRDEWSAMCGRYKQERDALIQKLDAWQEIAEHLHHLVQHPAYGVDQAIRRMDVLEAYKHLNNGH
jgi:uncharacterized coiled-coil DUF342 family protein